jgi:hypothetical protein
VHVTHVGILAVAAAGALLGYAVTGLPLRDLGRRALAALLAILVVLGTQVSVNGVLFGRWSVSPAGSGIPFRKAQRGWTDPALARSPLRKGCAAALCALRPSLPRDSQQLLWSDGSPLHSALWDPSAKGNPQWALVDMMSRPMPARWRKNRSAFSATERAPAGTSSSTSGRSTTSAPRCAEAMRPPCSTR